jgi:hypothetical protein
MYRKQPRCGLTFQWIVHPLVTRAVSRSLRSSAGTNTTLLRTVGDTAGAHAPRPSNPSGWPNKCPSPTGGGSQPSQSRSCVTSAAGAIRPPPWAPGRAACRVTFGLRRHVSIVGRVPSGWADARPSAARGGVRRGFAGRSGVVVGDKQNRQPSWRS